MMITTYPVVCVDGHCPLDRFSCHKVTITATITRGVVVESSGGSILMVAGRVMTGEMMGGGRLIVLWWVSVW